MKTKKLYTKIFTIMAFCLLVNPGFAHWTTKGPYGGKVNCLLSSDTLVFVGSADGGVYRSTNAAVNTWRYANYNGLLSGEINALAKAGTLIVAGTGDGIYVSADIGTTWQSAVGLSNPDVLSLSTIGSKVFAGTNGGGICISNDNGLTWAASNTGLTNLVVKCIASDGTNIYVGTGGGGVFMSSDNGVTWTAVNSGIGSMNITALVVSGGHVFAGTATGVFVSNTGTVLWGMGSLGLTSISIHSLYASGGKVYAGTTFGVAVTDDVTPSWSDISTGYSGIVKSICIFNSKLYIGTPSLGIYKSNSITSVSWTPHNTGFNNLETYSVYNSGLLVIAGTNKGLFVSRDLAANYVPANDGLTDSIHVYDMVFVGSDLYVATLMGVFMSADTGRTWVQENTGLTSLNLKKIAYGGGDLIVAANDGNVFHASTSGSTLSWVASTGLPPGLNIRSVATSGSVVFLGTMGNGIYMSSGFTSWNTVNTGLTSNNITSVLLHGTALYAASSDAGIFISNSVTMPSMWTAVNTGLPTSNILTLHGSGSWIMAGYKGGVHASENNGLHWYPTNVMEYIPNYADVRDISFSSTSTRMFIATPNNSLYSNNVSELPEGMGIHDMETNQLFSLAPNPNNGRFSIMLKDGADEIKEIVLYDAAGKTVQQISLSNKINRYDLSVNVQKGIYLVKVFTTNGSTTQRLVIE